MNLMDRSNPSKFMAAFHQLIQQPRHREQCNQLVLEAMPHSAEQDRQLFFGHLMVALRKITSADAGSSTSLTAAPVSLAESAHGKIRYVGGRCVAKTRYRHTATIRAAMDNGRLDQSHLERRQQVKVLEALCATQSELVQDSAYFNSLHETARRQNLHCGLTNITDGAFKFFLELEGKRLPLHESTRSRGQHMLKEVESLLLEDKDLYKVFKAAVDIGSANIQAEADIQRAFKDVIQSYLRVTDAEFKKRLLTELGKKKTMEHRKRVAGATEAAQEKRATPASATTVASATTATTSASATTSSEPLYSCSLCGKVCKSKSGLTCHMRIHKK